MSSAAKIILKNISKAFTQPAKESITLFHDLNFQFIQNKTYGLCGVSGTGKSTLINIICGFEAPTSGKVEYENLNVKDIGIVFQYPYLIPELQVLENVILKGLIAGRSLDECKSEGLEILYKVGLSDKAYSSTGSLSGGQQQRVSISRALFNRPKFLIADEPTAHLDKESAQNIIDILLKAHKEYNIGLIVSSHDNFITNKMEDILEIKDRQIILQQQF